MSAGTLRVNGALTSEITVDAHGTLGGSGTITGNIINYGTLAVGNSIGTLNHTGTYEHRGGDFVVEVAPGGNTPGVHNDVLNVTGDVEIDSGRVVINAAPGAYTNGTLYTFLTYTGNSVGNGPMGGFTSVIEDLRSSMLTPSQLRWQVLWLFAHRQPTCIQHRCQHFKSNFCRHVL